MWDYMMDLLIASRNSEPTEGKGQKVLKNFFSFIILACSRGCSGTRSFRTTKEWPTVVWPSCSSLPLKSTYKRNSCKAVLNTYLYFPAWENFSPVNHKTFRVPIYPLALLPRVFPPQKINISRQNLLLKLKI